MKPMLAYTIEDTSKISYPCFVSLKLDGIRVLILDGVVYSRSMKPIRSKAVQKLFGKPEYNGLDGEILYGPWNAPNVFNLTTQTVMATDLKPEFSEAKLHMAVFDYTLQNHHYCLRNQLAEHIVITRGSQMQMLKQAEVANEQELLAFETKALEGEINYLIIEAVQNIYKDKE